MLSFTLIFKTYCSKSRREDVTAFAISCSDFFFFFLQQYGYFFSFGKRAMIVAMLREESATDDAIGEDRSQPETPNVL